MTQAAAARSDVTPTRTRVSPWCGRWWGIELSFEPELDEVFGVTNNKQAATNFLQLDLDEDAKTEGMTPGEYREYLEELEDPRLAIYDISQEITRHLNDVIRPQIKRMKEGTKEASSAMTSNAPEMVATKTVLRSREKDGAVGRSDKQEQMPVEQRTADLKQELMSEGVPEKEAEEIAVEYVQKNLKFLFEKAELPKHTMFDISSVAGTIVIKLNVKHLAWDHLFALTDSQGSQSDSTKALKLLLAAWARLEDEAGDKRRDELEDIRLDWGRKTRDFLKEADD